MALGRVGALRFDGRVMLVTGAGGGIGRAHALLLASRGAQVVVADVGADVFGQGFDPRPARRTVEAIRAFGGAAEAYTADLADPAGARGAIDATLDTFGRIDGLIHTAGFTLGGREFVDDELGRLDALLDINARAGFQLARHAWPHMLRIGFGRIVFTASTAVYGMARSVAYSTAKAALIGLTRSLADEGRDAGITVNAIAPTAATRMLVENMTDSPFKSWLVKTMLSELVSPLGAALLHDDCPVTGEFFVVGGGRVAATRLAETRGYIDAGLTPELLFEHFEDVLDPHGAAYPGNTAESSELAARLLGCELSEPVSVVARTAAPQRSRGM